MWQAILFVLIFAPAAVLMAWAEALRHSATGDAVNWTSILFWPAVVASLGTLLVAGIVSIIP